MASINISNQPDAWAPSNSELWFRLTSGSYSISNFKYITKVNLVVDGSTSVTGNVEYVLPPRPSGDAIFTPHSMLNSYYKFNNDFNSSFQMKGVTNSVIYYNIRYGYSYNPNLPYYDFFFYNNSNVGITFSSPHNLNIGDKIIVDKSNKQVNISYDGDADIIAVPNPNFVVINKPWSGFNTPVGTDGGKIIGLKRMLGNTTNKKAFNGTRQYDQASYDFSNDVIKMLSTGKFATNQPRVKDIHENSFETLSFYKDGSITTFMVILELFNGTSLLSRRNSSLTNSNSRVDIFCGTNNLTLDGISLANTTHYTIHLELMNGTIISEKMRYNINRDCTFVKPDEYVKFRFLNRLGTWDYFTFTGGEVKTTNINRSEYSKYLPWDYKMGDRGKSVYNINADESYVATSGWINDETNKWLEELYTSPEVYVIRNGKLYPIIITDTTFKHKSQLRDILYNITVNYKMSNPINTQSN